MKVLVLHIVVVCPKLLNHAYTVPLVTQPCTIPNSISLPSPLPRCMCRNISTLNHNYSVPLGNGALPSHAPRLYPHVASFPGLPRFLFFGLCSRKNKYYTKCKLNNNKNNNKQGRSGNETNPHASTCTPNNGKLGGAC